MKNKSIIFLIVILTVVCVMFTACGKKDDEASKKAEDLKIEINEVEKNISCYNDALENGDVDDVLLYADDESALYKKLKRMDNNDFLMMLGFNKATALGMADDELETILEAVAQNTDTKVIEVVINDEKTEAVAKVEITEPDYTDVSDDGGMAEFLETRGMEASELSLVSYDEYQRISEEYTKWISEEKIPALEKITLTKEYTLKKADNKWMIESISE